jgi:hypothetical protein
MPASLQGVEPAKISFLNTSTNVFVGHVPEMFIGTVLKCCPSVGVLIVAAIVGGFPGIVPLRPIEDDSGPSYGVAA